jgi:uncharacterized protein (DUF433 family)
MMSTMEHVQEREGEYYVANTRAPIGLVVAAWKRETPPEHIVGQLPTLSLTDVYGVITYYLDHQDELEAHFAQLRDEYERERLRERAERPEFFATLRQRMMAGAWSDLQDDDEFEALDRIRHESKPSPAMDERIAWLDESNE